MKTFRINFIAVELFIITILFFSITPILSWDSGHYLKYLETLNGNASFSSWDIARGIVFPYLIKISTDVFGHTLNGIMVMMFIFYLLSFYIIKMSLKQLFPKNNLVYVLFIVLFALDALIFGWYHVLLTEFVASTITIVAIYLGYWYTFNSYENSKIKFIVVSILFLILIPISWHLKQPYILLTLIPLVISVISSYFLSKKNNTKKTKYIKISILIMSLFLTFLSIQYWKDHLKNHNNNMAEKRSSKYFLAKQITTGVRFIGDGKINLYSDLTTTIKQNTILDNEEKQDLIKIFDDGMNIKSSVLFLKYNFLHHPYLLFEGYIKNYLSIANLVDHEFYENKAIAYRCYQDSIKNTFHMPPYEKYIVNFKQVIDESLVGKFFSKLIKKSDIMFSLLLILAPILMIISFIQIRKSSDELYIRKMYMVFLINFLAFIHVFEHAFLGAIIDRYAFPVYPILLLSIIIVFVEVLKKLNFMNFVRNKV